MSAITPDERHALERTASHFAGDCDVMALHALSQPLVGEMQKVIRFQRDTMEESANLLLYVLRRIREDQRVAEIIGVATQSYENLTEAYADLARVDVDSLRDNIISGSAAIHRRREKEEANHE